VLTRAADLDEFLAHGREFRVRINREIYAKPRRKQSRIDRPWERRTCVNRLLLGNLRIEP
jgi:hypothetical protein